MERVQVGDKVKCLIAGYGVPKRGGVYTVSEVDERGEHFNLAESPAVTRPYFIEDFQVMPRASTAAADTAPSIAEPVIPQDDADRKTAPMYRGLLGYFPWALYQVAKHSLKADLKHNPDSKDLDRPHWAFGKSMDHLDCIVRHMSELHTDELYHRTAIAWRGLAQLQEYGMRCLGFGPGANVKLQVPE